MHMRIDVMQWHDAVNASIDDGYSTFVTLTGVDDDGVQVWLRLRNAAGEDVVLHTIGETVSTVTDLLPAAAWYERETAEMFGVHFIGHDTHPLLLREMHAPLRREHFLDARNNTVWPGGKEPGESGDRPPSRRRLLPPGVKP